MIYTITFNPAIDYVMKLDGITPGRVNRSRSERIFFGGKGINVSAVLAQLGIDSVALGFAAGFTGYELERGVREMGINTDLVHLKHGLTRINVKLHTNEDTEINAAGPEIDEAAADEFYRRTDRIKSGDTVVIAGSIPKSMPDNTYEKLLERLSDRKIRIAADAEKRLLTNILKYEPYVIKPNIHELSDIFETTITSLSEVEKYASALRNMGAVNVLVSMGEEGAFLLDETGRTHFRKAFTGNAVNTVGAGDSMLAGFLAGAEKDYGHALLLGTACGAATAFSEGLADRETIAKLLKLADS